MVNNSHRKPGLGFQIFLLSILSLMGPQSKGVAQDSLVNVGKYQPIRIYQVGYTMGPIIAHSSEVQNTQGSIPRGLEFTLAWQRNDQDAWNKCGCSPTQGVQFAYYDYDNVSLGKSLNVSYMLEPTYRLSSRSSFSYRAIFGISYMTNPYDVYTNPTNQSYTTTVNGFIGAGVGYWHHLSDHWSLGGLVEFHHISNSGLQVPNFGINWPTAGINLRYRTNPRRLQVFQRTPFIKNKHVLYDVSIFGTVKKLGTEADGTSTSYPLAGVAFQAARQVGRINNLTVGTEIFWDNALKKHLLDDGSGLDPWRMDIMVGHEFILGRLLFSQRIGVYIYQAGNYFDPFFHQWGLTYRIIDHWSVGVDLKVHTEVADYGALRFTHTF